MKSTEECGKFSVSRVATNTGGSYILGGEVSAEMEGVKEKRREILMESEEKRGGRGR